MNESQEGLNYSEMKAELQVLRKKLEDLETNQAALRVSAHPTARRRFPKRLITAAIWLAVLLVVGGGLLWGENPLKALIINDQGNVGIGREPTADKLSVGGNALINNALIGDVGRGPGWAGFMNNSSARVSGYALAQSSDGTTTLINKAPGKGFIGFMIGNATAMQLMYNGAVGIGKDPTEGKNLDVLGDSQFRANLGVTEKLTAKDLDVTNKATITTLQGLCPSPCDLRIVQPKLTIQGDVRVNGTMDASNTTGGINGEKPRFKLTIPAGGGGWNTAVVDIKDLCGDEDGCRIKLLMQHKDLESHNPVRIITADLYMVQRTENGPIKGYTRSSGAGNHEAIWTLNNGSATTLLDTWSDWFSISNTYYPGDWFCGGAPAKSASAPAACVQNQQPYGSGQNNWRNGDDSYLVGFRFHKDITATILIYDR